MAAHMDIGKISFTGSIASGRKVQNAATNSNLKRVTLERTSFPVLLLASFNSGDLDTDLRSSGWEIPSNHFQ